MGLMPDVQAICADWIKHLLLFKPADPVAEAAKYFAQFMPDAPKPGTPDQPAAAATADLDAPTEPDAPSNAAAAADPAPEAPAAPTPGADADANTPDTNAATPSDALAAAAARETA